MTIESELHTYLDTIRVTLVNARDRANEIETVFPELCKTIRESEAWTKYLVFKIMVVSDLYKVIPASDRNRVFNDYVSSKEELVKSFKRESKRDIIQIESLVRDIIYRDTDHLDSLSVPIKQMTI
jgi:hypothetical protein